MPQLATRDVEDTKPVYLRPAPPMTWYQRTPGTVVAGGLGIFLLAAIVFAVINVSNESTQPPGIVRAPATPLTRVPSVSTSSPTAPSSSAPASPAPASTAPASTAPPSASPSAPPPADNPSSPPDSPSPVPPTVTETASTLNVPTEAPAPGWPGPPGDGSFWRHLFPHLFGGG